MTADRGSLPSLLHSEGKEGSWAVGHGLPLPCRPRSFLLPLPGESQYPSRGRLASTQGDVAVGFGRQVADKQPADGRPSLVWLSEH